HAPARGNRVCGRSEPVCKPKLYPVARLCTDCVPVSFEHVSRRDSIFCGENRFRPRGDGKSEAERAPIRESWIGYATSSRRFGIYQGHSNFNDADLLSRVWLCDCRCFRGPSPNHILGFGCLRTTSSIWEAPRTCGHRPAASEGISRRSDLQGKRN